MQEKIFNIRVYGIYINDNHEILLSHEQYDKLSMIKFPGGGLEYGESTLECLHRECMEEAGISIEIGDHIYTTDYFQKSFVNDNQIIAIYYKIKPIQRIVSVLQTPEGYYKLHPLTTSLITQLTMPIDKKVMQLILEKQILQRD